MPELLGFTPDLDITTPNGLPSCMNVVPTSSGVGAINAFTPYDIGGSLVGDVNAAALIVGSDGTLRPFVSTATGVYEVISEAYVDRFTHTTTPPAVSFAALGSVSLVANGVDPVAASTDQTQAFDTITGAPVAHRLVTASGFAMALGYGNEPSAWWCSGLFDYTTWTPDQGTQAANGILYQTPGAITAGVNYNDDVIVFKRDAVYRGRFVGVPNIWEWDVLSDAVGCVNQDAVCVTPNGVLFAGLADIYMLTGTNIQSLGNVLRKWYARSLDTLQLASVKCQYDNNLQVVYINFVAANGAPYQLVYDLPTGRFGQADLSGMSTNATVVAVFSYTKGTVTCDGLGTLYPSADAIDVPFNTPLWLADSAQSACVGSDGLVYARQGDYADASVTLAAFGDPVTFSQLTKAMPLWTKAPTAGSCSASLSSSNAYYTELALTKQANLYSRAFHFVKTGRWFQLKILCKGEWELVNIKYDYVTGGPR